MHACDAPSVTVVGWEAAPLIDMIVPALLVQTTAAAANPPILYDWRPPLTRGWANRSRSVTCVRGLMNSGTNFARSLVEQVGGVTVLEDRKHMYPWVLEARAQAAPGASVALVIARHPLSWVCLLYTSPSPRDRQKSRMPSSA